MFLSRLRTGICGLAVALVLAGCGGGSGDSTQVVPFKGVAKYKQTPLSHYQLYLVQENIPYAIAATDEAGAFEFGTYKPGDGAVPGEHKLFVSYLGPKQDDEYAVVPPSKIKLPPAYLSAGKTTAKVVVPSSGSTDFEIVLE